MELVLSVNRDRKRRKITDSLLLMDGISWITNLSTKFLKLQKDFLSVRNTCFSCSARVHMKVKITGIKLVYLFCFYSDHEGNQVLQSNQVIRYWTILRNMLDFYIKNIN